MTGEFSKEMLRLLEDGTVREDLVDLGMRRVRDHDWDRSAERLAEPDISLVCTDAGRSFNRAG